MDAVIEGAKAPAVANDDEDRLSREVQQARTQLAQAIQTAGLKNDPLSKVLEAISTSMGVQHQLHVANANMRRDLGARFREDLTAAVREAREPIDPDSIRRIEAAAGAGVNKHAAALVKAHNRRTVLLTAGALVGALVAGCAGGWWWGHSSAIARFRLSEAGFAAMMHDSPVAATGWLNLARLNDYALVMGACHGADGTVTPDGRHACAAPLWLDDEKATPPPVKSDKP